MFFLLDENIKKNLNDFSELSENMKTIPDGLTSEQTDAFIRILQAKSPTEIADLSTEKIMELLYLVQEMAPYIGQSNIFDNNSDSFKNTLLELPSMKCRRVL